MRRQTPRPPPPPPPAAISRRSTGATGLPSSPLPPPPPPSTHPPPPPPLSPLQKNSATISALPRRVMPCCSRTACLAMGPPAPRRPLRIAAPPPPAQARCRGRAPPSRPAAARRLRAARPLAGGSWRAERSPHGVGGGIFAVLTIRGCRAQNKIAYYSLSVSRVLGAVGSVGVRSEPPPAGRVLSPVESKRQWVTHRGGIAYMVLMVLYGPYIG